MNKVTNVGWMLAALIVMGCGGSVTADDTTGTSRAELTSTDDDGRCEAPEGNISETPSELFESETSVAHARDGSTVAVWIANTDVPYTGGVQTIGYRVFRPECRHGRGAWGPVQSLTAPNAFYHSDPTVVADRNGDFYIAFLTADGPVTPPFNFPQFPDDAVRIYVARLPRGASATLPPVLVSGEAYSFDDKPWIGVTPGGAVALTYLGGDLSDESLSVLARSTDHGATWTHSIVDEGPAFLPQLCVPVDGGRRIYATDIYAGSAGDVGHQDDRREAAASSAAFGTSVRARLAQRRMARTPTPGPGPADQPAVHLHWSDDDGVTWNSGGFNVWPVDANTTWSVPTCAARGDDVWIAAAVAPTGDFPPVSMQVQVGHFERRGLTFDKTVAPDMGGNFFYWQPMIVATTDGALDLFSYVDRNYWFYEERTDGMFVRLRSQGDGARWSAPEVLADRQWNSGERHGIGFQGDYIGAAPREDGALDITFVPVHQNEPQHVQLLHLRR